MASDLSSAAPDWLSKGDNAWQLTAASLVALQSIPGLMLLYAGIVKRKWAINSMFVSPPNRELCLTVLTQADGLLRLRSSTILLGTLGLQSWLRRIHATICRPTWTCCHDAI